ncbi:hypothetical protein KXX03_002768, partial [Aspergillus fumigatus]
QNPLTRLNRLGTIKRGAGFLIARSALAQEEAEEFNGEFSDPINIHLDSDRDGCAC